MKDLLELRRPLTSGEIRRVVQVMTGHYRWPDFDLPAAEFRRKVEAMTSPTLRDVVELVYLEHLGRSKKARWGDKTPGYIEFVPQLANLFPGARFIHLIRDGRDVAKSFQARRWHGRWLHRNAREWISAMAFAERWRNSSSAAQFLEVRYEDLVLEQEREVRRICAFLGEEFEPQMLSWQEDVDKLVPTRELHIHEKLTQTPNAGDVGRWKRELSAREILVSEAFMGRQLRAHGYALRFAGSGWRPVLGATRIYCEHILPIVSLPLKALRFLREQLFGPLGRPQAKAGHGR